METLKLLWAQTQKNGFPDDDFADFLPAGWVGDGEKKSVSGYKPRKRGPGHMSLKSPNIDSPHSNTLHRSTLKQGSSKATILGSRAVDSSSLPISTKDLTTTKEPNIGSIDNVSMAATTEKKQSSVSISRLQVPSSLLRQPRTAVETLQEQNKSLKLAVERRDRELKHANLRITKFQSAIVKAEEERAKVENIFQEKVKSLQEKLRAVVPAPELQMERDEIEGQRQKATSELKKLREKSEKVAKRFSVAGKKLIVVNEDLAIANVQITSLTVARKDLENTIRSLNRTTENSRISQHRLQAQLLREQASNIRFQIEINNLTASNSVLSEQLNISRTTLNRSAANSKQSAESSTAINELKNLRFSFNKLTIDLNKSLRDVEDIRHDRDSYKADYFRAREQRDGAKTKVLELEMKYRRQSRKIESLVKEKQELEEQRDLLDPIVQIGVDVRLRNLEWARETVLNIPATDIDRAIILSGNIAAHRANGVVDAAMFEADLVPEEYIEEASEVFEKMYDVKPRDIGRWSEKMLRLIDCRATVLSLKAVNKAGNSSALRREHEKLEDSLFKDHDLLTRRTFENNPDVEHRLARMEELTEMIVDIERSKAGRRK
ncbi:hypothetical protein WAI453_001656 [Rhynchosporium graminicola]